MAPGSRRGGHSTAIGESWIWGMAHPWDGWNDANACVVGEVEDDSHHLRWDKGWGWGSSSSNSNSTRCRHMSHDGCMHIAYLLHACRMAAQQCRCERFGGTCHSRYGCWGCCRCLRWIGLWGGSDSGCGGHERRLQQGLSCLDYYKWWSVACPWHVSFGRMPACLLRAHRMSTACLSGVCHGLVPCLPVACMGGMLVCCMLVCRRHLWHACVAWPSVPCLSVAGLCGMHVCRMSVTCHVVWWSHAFRMVVTCGVSRMWCAFPCDVMSRLIIWGDVTWHVRSRARCVTGDVLSRVMRLTYVLWHVCDVLHVWRGYHMCDMFSHVWYGITCVIGYAWCVLTCVICYHMWDVLSYMWCGGTCVICSHMCGRLSHVWYVLTCVLWYHMCDRLCVICSHMCDIFSHVWYVFTCVICYHMCDVLSRVMRLTYVLWHVGNVSHMWCVSRGR